MTHKGSKKTFRIARFRLPQSAERLFSLALIFFDALLIDAIFIGVFSLWFWGTKDSSIYINAYHQIRFHLLCIYIVSGLLIGSFNIRNLYAASDIFLQTSGTLLSTFIGFNLLAFLSREMATLSYNFPRAVFMIATVISAIATVLLRAVLTNIFQPHQIIKRTIIIGNQAEGRRIIRHFHRRGGVRFRIVQVMKSEQQNDLAAEVIFRHAHEIFVTDPTIDLDQFWAKIFYDRKEAPHEFKVRISSDPRKAAGVVALRSLEDFPLITISSHSLTNIQKFVKRTFDIVFSLFALLVSLPVTVIAIIMVRLDSPGSFFFKQRRIGRYGKEFDVIKFRTMRVGSEANTGPQVSTSDDPRVSTIGRFLRHFGIDELPQFFLVLTGEMSVVGPRPERQFFARNHYEFQGRRLSVKPGVTGLAAVNSRYYLRLVDKVTYDYYYLDNYSFILDIKIIFQTVWVLLFKSNKDFHNVNHELDNLTTISAEKEKAEIQKEKFEK